MHRLKYSVLLGDADLAALRASPQWAPLSASLAGGSGTAGGAASVRLRAEAKAPFRTLRLFLLGGLGAGAAIGFFVTAPALLKSLLALPGAADVTQTGGNLAVDLGVLAGCGFLLSRELAARAALEAGVAREEELGALRVAVSAAGRGATLASLRGAYRPVLLTGSRAALRAAARTAEPYRRELTARGVLLVLLEDEAAEAAAAPPKPKGFGAPPAAAAPGGAGAAPDVAAEGAEGADARWKAPPLDAAAWRSWAAEQRTLADPPLPPGTAMHVAVALDGTLARTGPYTPKWCARCDVAAQAQRGGCARCLHARSPVRDAPFARAGTTC